MLSAYIILLTIYSILETVAFPVFIVSLFAWVYILVGFRKKSQKFRIVTAVAVIEVVFSILAISLFGFVISLVLVIYPYTQAIRHTQKVRKARGKNV